MSEEQKHYIDVLASVYMAAGRAMAACTDDLASEYHLGALETTENIAQFLGVKARMHKRIEAIEAQEKSTERKRS